MTTRKAFLVYTAGGSLALLLGACGGSGGGGGDGGDGGDDPLPPPPSSQDGCSAFAVANNHGHSLAIPVADLDSTTERSYSIQGLAPHVHRVTINAAQFAALKAGQSIRVTSTLGGPELHQHDLAGVCV